MVGEGDEELARLLNAALSGDDQAYADFLRRAAGLVRRFAQRRITFGGLDPEDIVQETLLAVHLKRHTWRNDSPVGPWLYAIARFKLIDAFRRANRRLEVPVDGDFDAPAPEPEDRASEREIDRALATLPPREQSVVSAISVDGRSIVETAQALDMTEGAVRVALHRGLARIARTFGRM
ncbi:sigma-70 family RNA polymerase sigma factor [Mesorhizobium marinum]|uniref:sigma-70 family RNA polymerase sigma factor n=1 Tax=Mesorhizobium marinum TaxID=3228790 RepID=UPI00346655E5